MVLTALNQIVFKDKFHILRMELLKRNQCSLLILKLNVGSAIFSSVTVHYFLLFLNEIYRSSIGKER